MKRVLFVSYIFAPMIGGGVHRVTQTCKYFSRFGWVPTVLTVSDQSLSESDRDDRLLGELPEEVRIERTYCPLSRVGALNRPNRRTGLMGVLRSLKRAIARFVFLPDWQIVWYPWAVRAGKKVLAAGQHDAIVASYGPATNMLVAARLAKVTGLPLVLDFRDTWADNPLPIFTSRWHRSICQRIERRLVAQASKVIGVSQPMADHYRTRYGLSEDKVACITNGFDPEDLPRGKDSRGSQPRPFRLCFTGSVYGNVHLTDLFLAIRDMAEAGKITPERFRLQFVGNMTIDEPRELGVEEYIDVHPPVPHKQVFDFLSESDVLLIVEMVGYHARFSYASKLFDYMLCGKPIFALTEDSDQTARVVRDLGGIVAHPEDRQAIRESLEAMLVQGPAEWKSVNVSDQPWAAFDRKTLTRRFADVLDQAVGRSTKPIDEDTQQVMADAQP